MPSTTTGELYKTILLFGPPGSGKGTWGKILGMIPGFYHISTGEMFRTIDTESELGLRVMEIMQKGELVPDDIAFDLLKQHVQKTILLGAFRPQKDVLVLDGFPRTSRQAAMLASVAAVKVILQLDCADREILGARLRRRAVLELRADDANEAIIRHRFAVYESEIREALDQFPDDLIERVDVSAPPMHILASTSAIVYKRLSAEAQRG